MSDMLREMKKPRFNTALLVKVFTHFMSLMFMLWHNCNDLIVLVLTGCMYF